MTKPDTLLPEVEAALAAAALGPRDGAAAALCRRYAQLIDHAASLAAEAEVLWENADPDDTDTRRALAKIRLAVSSQNVASDLGPKLLAGLTALGCTLAGRGDKGKETQRDVDPARLALDELRSRRAQRADRAAAVDASAP